MPAGARTLALWGADVDKLSPADPLGLLCPLPESSRGGGEGHGQSPEALGNTCSDMTRAVSESRHSGLLPEMENQIKMAGTEASRDQSS